MNKNSLLFLSVFCIIKSFGQIGFEENIITDDEHYADGAESVYAADIDGDGDMDMLSASFGDDKIAWYENTDGKGAFGLQQIITTNADYAQSVYAIDIDGDGDMDVLSASAYDDKIAWYENLDGKGAFGSQQIITTSADNALSVYAIDVDGDGDMDVLSASEFDDKIAWYENLDGKGAFGSQQIITTNADNAQSVYAADIDGDGDMDVLSASRSDDKIAWYENTDGQGTFGSEQIISANANWAKSVYATDLDGDGDMDVLSASFSDDKIAWYENTDGQGTFGSQKIITTNADGADSVYATDFDGDGDMDVLSAYDDRIAWYENTDGSGAFGSQKTIIIDANSPTSIYSADLDGDGDMDVLSTSQTDDKISWFENTNGNGTFGKQQIVTTNFENPKSIYSIDLDGDGDMDVLSASESDDKISWFENKDGKGLFSIKHIITTNANGANSVYATDLDGDGDMDVLSSSYWDHKIAWYKNIDGKGTFGSERIISTNAFRAPELVYATDLDGDGDMDVLAISSSKLVWYKNTNGKGAFSSEQIITTNSNRLTSAFATDLDGDGDLDVLSTSSGDDKVAWYENTDGKGIFGSEQIITTNANFAKSVYAVDLDGDDDMDVISASSNDEKIAWYENTDGNGAFGSQQIITTDASLAASVYATDLDSDGDIDVLYASNTKIAWHENIDGQGAFDSEQIINSNIDSGRSVYATDLDGDGNMDVLSASFLDDKIAWYKNLGLLNNKIVGEIKFDINADGCGSTDSFASNLLLKTIDGTENFSTFSLANGYYQLFVTEGNFNTHIENLPSYFTSNPVSQTTVLTGIGNVEIVDFCIEPNQTINDLNISVYPSQDDPRPGFDTSYRIIYNNLGTTQLSGNITFEFDDNKIQFLSASETVASQTSNTLTFGYTGLNPFETRTIDLEFNVFPPPTTNIDDVLITKAIVNQVAEDNTPDDNIFKLNQTVIGSYDPNDIRVLEGEEISLEQADEYLHYIIRFQNTGTASAINVNVENVLDDDLDWTTIQLESLSHTGRVEITNGNMVKFIFDDINLPDSTNDKPNSHGFIAYKIKPKTGVVIGDVFNNTADIFFDFNPPITTNTAFTEIASSLSVSKNLISKFYVYPNPAKNVLNIQSKTKIVELYIYNNIGQVVSSELNKATIDISRLSAGLYFIKIKDTFGNSEIKKMIKK